MRYQYDLIIIGGGLAGSTLAKTMAEHGANVLVLERTKAFTDRVRGEQIHPWGVAEMKELGVYNLLEATCGHQLPWWDSYANGEFTRRRDLPATTPQNAPEFAFYHPAMQDVLIQAASDAGAEVRRGAVVTQVQRNQHPTVTIQQDGQTQTITARLVVIANGRGSPHRVQAGFVVQRDPVKRQIAGLHLENFPLQEDASHIFSRPGSGWMAVFFPQGNGRVRSYVMYPKSSPLRIQGASDIPQYTNQMVALGVPATLFAHARATGPLATFDGADVWVDSPYRNGIVLIGDAAAANDPSFGCGLSLTVRDVRTLRDHLLQHEDWDVAGHAYATEHDQYYGILHTVTGWMGQLLFDIGPEADARRARALPLLAEDSTRALDHIFSGPDRPVDETTRRRYFGEE